MKKIGIFAGAFDPIHKGHLAFAKKALEGGLEKVYFLPEQFPGMKPNASDIKVREAQIISVISDNSKFEVIILDQNNFKTKTTIEELGRKLPETEMFFMFGDDVLDHIDKWEDLEYLSKKTQLIIATRKYSRDEIQRIFKNFTDNGLNFSFQIIELAEDISSTQIRQLIK